MQHNGCIQELSSQNTRFKVLPFVTSTTIRIKFRLNPVCLFSKKCKRNVRLSWLSATLEKKQNKCIDKYSHRQVPHLCHYLRVKAAHNTVLSLPLTCWLHSCIQNASSWETLAAAAALCRSFTQFYLKFCRNKWKHTCKFKKGGIQLHIGTKILWNVTVLTCTIWKKLTFPVFCL